MGENFFSQTSGVGNFFYDIKRCKIFFLALYALRDIFFSAGILSPGISLQDFFSLEISLGNFFLKSPISYSLRDQTPFSALVSPAEGNKCRKRRLVSQATHTPPPSKVKWSAPNLTSASGHHSRVTVTLQRHNLFSVVVSETFGGKQFCRQMSCDIGVTNESGRFWRKNFGYITISNYFMSHKWEQISFIIKLPHFLLCSVDVKLCSTG